MNLPSRRWWVALLAPVPMGAGQILLPNRRVDDIVTRVSKLEERVQSQGERLAALESRAPAKVGQ